MSLVLTAAHRGVRSGGSGSSGLRGLWEMFDWGDSGWEFGVFFILARYVWLDFGGLGRILAFGATSARVRGRCGIA